jgi:hypothetical protein
MTIYVTGLGRCGTTLVTNMLYNTGLKCSGAQPSFEDARTASPVLCDQSWETGYDVIKRVDPTLFPFQSKPNDKIIWIRRTYYEQARSTIKFINAVAEEDIVEYDKDTIMRLTENLRDDTLHFLKEIEHTDHIVLNFEDLIKGDVDKLASFLSLPHEKLRDVIIERQSACYDGLLETQLPCA